MSYHKYKNVILDDRVFFKQPSIQYENVVYAKDENDLKERMDYSYGNPLQDDLYSSRYNQFLIGNRDMDVNAKPYTDIQLPKEEKEKVIKDKNVHTEVCGLDDSGVSVCGKDKKLDKILDPQFNLREVAKNSILLEDHLFQKARQCNDCIKKHCLLIEGFLEEAITLDKKKQYTQELDEYLAQFRSIFLDLAKKLNEGDLTVDECRDFAQKLRQFRKPICQKYATFF